MRQPLLPAGVAVFFSMLALGCGSKGVSERDAAYEGPPAPISLCERYGTDAATPVYQTVQQIFDENCGNGCHIQGADLQLTPGPAWPRLVGQKPPLAEACGGVLVEPGAPNASYLYEKLSSSKPCSGDQMPRGDFGPVPLPDCVVGLIYDWIAEGAPGPGGTPAGDAGLDGGDGAR